MNVQRREMTESKRILDKASEMLRLARKQAKGEGHTRRARQAAGKVWSAAMLAAEAVNGKISGAEDVFTAFWRAWGTKGREFAKFIEGALYRGSCLGGSRACDGRFVLHHARRLARLFRKRPRKNRGGRPPGEKEPPSCVVDYQRALDRFVKRDQRLVRRVLPAPRLVRTLISFFRRRLDGEKQLHRFMTMNEAWSMKYGPKSHLHKIEWKARKRIFSFLIGVLRTHRRALSSNMPENADGQDRHAIEALEAVGLWWKDNRRSYKVRMREKRALDSCAKIHDYCSAVLEGSNNVLRDTKRHTAALKWMTKHIERNFDS